MKKRIRDFFFLFICLLLVVLCDVIALNAAVPHLINYQGRLTDTSGKPLEGSYSLTFRLYDGETAGSLLWQGTYNSVSITKGVFSILLGDMNAPGFDFAALSFDKQYWLEIKVGDEVMTPRQRITSVGYAIRAEKAEQANNADTISNVGVNTTPTPNKLLPLDSNAKFPALTGLLGNLILHQNVYATNYITINTSSWSDLISINLNPSVSGTIIVNFYAIFRITGDHISNGYFRMLIDGTEVAYADIDFSQYEDGRKTTFLCGSKAVSSGTRTVKIQWYGTNDYGNNMAECWDRRLEALFLAIP